MLLFCRWRDGPPLTYYFFVSLLFWLPTLRSQEIKNELGFLFLSYVMNPYLPINTGNQVLLLGLVV